MPARCMLREPWPFCRGRQFKVTSLPATFLLDSRGQIAYSHTGYRPGDEVQLAARIERLLPAPGE